MVKCGCLAAIHDSRFTIHEQLLGRGRCTAWDGDTSGWYGEAKYSYGSRGAKKREAAASRAAADGPRTYKKASGPNAKMIDPRKHISTTSKNPLIIAVDVTGSMSNWPAEIFDRLPLLFNTLSQYRDDLEICFVAIGDARYDDWPLQVTTFASGYDLEQQLGSLYGEGGGGDGPEGYGLFAHWVNTHVEVPEAGETPFLIVFGDAPMHPEVPQGEIAHYLGDEGRPRCRRDQGMAEAVRQLEHVVPAPAHGTPRGCRGQAVGEGRHRAEDLPDQG